MGKHFMNKSFYMITQIHMFFNKVHYIYHQRRNFKMLLLG